MSEQRLVQIRDDGNGLKARGMRGALDDGEAMRVGWEGGRLSRAQLM